jgi:hypothetical protein
LSSEFRALRGGWSADVLWRSSDRDSVDPQRGDLFRGGSTVDGQLPAISDRDSVNPQLGDLFAGLRVASVPEPSTFALLLMTGAGALWWARRRR